MNILVSMTPEEVKECQSALKERVTTMNNRRDTSEETIQTHVYWTEKLRAKLPHIRPETTHG